MIKINQPQVDLKKILQSYPPRSMQRDIFNKLDLSYRTYYYDNPEQLKFEIDLRTQIVNSAYKLYRSGLDFAVFRKSRPNEKYWDRQSNGGFVLKLGAKPSEAIADIFKNGRKYATECATAMVIIYYMALLQVYPAELFDRVFDQITLMNWHSIDKELREIGMMKDKSDNIPGDRRYFKNSDVNLKTPEWQGENVIDLGNGEYYGHGMGIAKANEIIKELNANRREGAKESAYLMDTAGNPNYKRLSNILENYKKRNNR